MKRVAMLMSGGVDSSVSAALLQQQGYEVIGFYILGWLGTPDFPCPWQKEEKDARAVAEVLGIPFYTVNLSKVYEEEVIDRFFAGYQAGVTPNPDILCNREIKFKALWSAIRQFECDYIATGHYARAEDGQIFKAKDQNKDQTYFLWGIEKAILTKVIFPLGVLTKLEVRNLAKKYKLPTATKKDSQGICFVGPLKVRQFLASRVKTKPGDVYLTDGRKIATHEGVELYTIGQRLAAGSVDWTGDVPPLFVIAKDIKKNRLIVGADSQTFGSKLIAGSLNWLSQLEGPTFEGLAKIRYRQIDVPVKVHQFDADEVVSKDSHISRQLNKNVKVIFSEPVRAITAGQSIVFYSASGQLLGGGVIEVVPEQDETVQQLTKALGKTKI